MTKISFWYEVGELFTDAGDVGGDPQAGKAYSRRFRHSTLPGRVVTIYAYPIEAEGPGDDEKSITLECQQEMIICRDTDDPGMSEEWSDTSYVDIPERFDLAYPTAMVTEAAALALVKSMEPEHIGWDGHPDFVIEAATPTPDPKRQSTMDLGRAVLGGIVDGLDLVDEWQVTHPNWAHAMVIELRAHLSRAGQLAEWLCDGGNPELDAAHAKLVASGFFGSKEKEESSTPPSEGMSTGEFVNLVTGGPGWNKEED